MAAEPLLDRVVRIARQMYPDRRVQRSGDDVEVHGLGRLGARAVDVRGKRTARVIARAPSEPEVMEYPVDPTSEGDLALAVANAIAFLENPKEYRGQYPNG